MPVELVRSAGNRWGAAVNLVLDRDDVIIRWVKERLPYVQDFGKAVALGLIGTDGAPLAGCVYSDYHPEYGTLSMSLVAESPRWATPNTIGMFLRYPFGDLRVNKVRAAVMHTNERCIRFLTGIGFTREAILKDEFGKGKHAVMFRMMAPEFGRMYGFGPAGASDAGPRPRRAA